MRKSGQCNIGWLWSVTSRLRSRFDTRAGAGGRECGAACRAAKEMPPQGPSTCDLGAPARDQADPSNLLRCRMETMHLDLEQLARSDPSMASELQRLCMRCGRRNACALELERPSADAAWGEWREYCPNAIKLNELRIRRVMECSPPFLRS